MFRRLSPLAVSCGLTLSSNSEYNLPRTSYIKPQSKRVSFFSSFLKLIKLEKRAKQFGCDLCFEIQITQEWCNHAFYNSETLLLLFFYLNQTLKKSPVFSSHPVWIIVTSCFRGSASRQSPISSLSINHLTIYIDLLVPYEPSCCLHSSGRTLTVPSAHLTIKGNQAFRHCVLLIKTLS